MHKKTTDRESNYMSIVENSPDFITRYDRGLRYIYMNKAGMKTLGVTKKQIIGKTHRETGFYDPVQCDYLEEKMNYVFETGKLYQEQFEWKSAEGDIWLDWRLTSENDKDGNIVSVLGVSRDITKIILAEKALRENEKIFSSFMENSPVYVFFKDSEIRSLRLSKNYEQMLGSPLDELMGKSMDDLFPSDLAKKMIEDDKRILKRGKLEVLDEEFNGRFYTTFKFPIHIDGNPKYLAGYSIDITDKKLTDIISQEKADELERFNNLMLGRELKMLELKKEINELLKSAGKDEKYKVHE